MIHSRPDIIIFVSSVLGLAIGLIGLAKFLYILPRSHAKIIPIALNIMIIVTCIWGIYFSTYRLRNFYALVKNLDSVANNRILLLKGKNKLNFEIIQDYEGIATAPTTRNDTIAISKKALKLRDEITRIQDTDLDVGLRIFKYDNLSYTYAIIAALEHNNFRAKSWADSCLYASKKALDFINDIKQKRIDVTDDYLKKLIIWTQDEDIENRLLWLSAWALAIKRVNGDINVQPSDIEDKIGKISSDIYLDSYPIKLIYQFQKLKGQFSESFRRRYFR